MIALTFCGFFCLGLVLILLGANQADLARDLDLDLTRTGLLASAFAAGMLIGMTGAGLLYDRLPRRPLFVATISLTAIALFGFGPNSNFSEALFLFAVIGLGSGAYDTLFNAAVAERYGQRSARPMTRTSHQPQPSTSLPMSGATGSCSPARGTPTAGTA